MSKYDFVLYAAQSADFIERLRELGLVDITVTGWEPSEEEHRLLTEIEGCGKALDYVRQWKAQPDHAALAAAAYATGEEACEAYGAVQRQAAALAAEATRLEKAAEELRPWGPFPVEQMQALAARGVKLRFFSAPASEYAALAAGWESDAVLLPVDEVAGYTYFIVAGGSDELSVNAQEMKFPTMDIREAERQIAACAAGAEALNGEIARVAASEALLAERYAALQEELQAKRITATARPAADGSLLVLEGWAEEETSDKVDTLLEQYPNVVWLKSRPTPEDDTPVKLKNNRFARIFELVGDMYARPKYGTIDLTPFFAPFYMLFFGICLNDAGYGLVLLLMGLWLLHKNPQPGMMNRAAWFATLCAASTVLFGGFCGSFFGMNLKEFFPNVPFYNFQGEFFSVALAIGMVQILFGMAINIWGITRAFGFKYALGTLGWFLILLGGSVAGGLPMLNPALAIGWFTTSSPAFYAVMGIGAALLLFLNTPGRNPLLNVGSGLWALYNNITGLLSDVLSYIRLFAIGLSGGVLALVFNSLADGFVPDGANIAVRILIMLPILLIGHGINLFMSAISSFVHPMRLTFVEFYKNAGFEMATRNFEPLRKMNQSNK